MTPRSLRRRLPWAPILGAFLALPAPCLASPGPASPDPAPRAHTERVTSELVLIETYVLDSRGRPTAGLTADDFELLVDGRKTPIASLDFREMAPIDSGPEAAAGGPPSGAAGAALPRRFVLFFEDGTSAPHGLDAARRAADQFLSTDPVRSDQFAVAAFDTSLRIIQDFTSDHDTLRRAIARSLKDPRRISDFAAQIRSHVEEIRRRMGALDQDGMLQTMRDSGRSAVGREDQMKQQSGTKEMQSELEGTKFLATSYAAGDMTRMSAVLQAMRTLVDSLAPWRGYKAIVFMGDGIPENPSLTYYDVITARQPVPDDMPTRAGSASRAQVPLQPQNYSLSADVKQLAQAAAAAGVTLHTVQTAGLVAGTAEENREAARRSDVLKTVALNTGGLASSSNDLLGALKDAEASSRRYYVLGFVPGGPPDGRFHPVQVRCRKRDASLRCRRGFVRLPASEERARSILAAHLLPDLFPELGLELNAVPGPGGPSGRVTDLVVRVPADRIIFPSETGGPTAHLEVALIALDDAGHTTFRADRRMSLVLGPESPERAGLSLEFFARVTLPPSDQSVTAVVSDDAAGAIGGAHLRLPASEAGGLPGLSLYSLAEESVWVDLADPGPGDSADERPARFTLGPSLKRSFAPGEPMACGFKLPAPRVGVSAPLRMAIRAGKTTFESYDETTDWGRAAGAMKIRLPTSGLAPGEYVVAVQEVLPAGAIDRATLPFRIREPGDDAARAGQSVSP